MKQIFVLVERKRWQMCDPAAGLPTDKLLSKLLSLFMKIKGFLTKFISSPCISF